MKGFTLIELVLSIAFIALISAIAFGVLIKMNERNDLDISIYHFKHSLNEARIKAKGQEGDSAWSVKLENKKIIVYRGSNFSTRNQLYDTTYAISNNITYTGTTDYIFEKKVGLLDSAKQVTFNYKDSSQLLNINVYGMVNK